MAAAAATTAATTAPESMLRAIATYPAKMIEPLKGTYFSDTVSKEQLQLFLMFFIGFVAIVSMVYFAYSTIMSIQNPIPYIQNILAIQAKQQEYIASGGKIEGFTSHAQNSLATLLQRIPESQKYLVNLCPLTAMLGGYIGPLQQGVFDSAFYIKTALNSGIRAFVLPISIYTDDNKQPPNWPISGDPAIVCRNSDGTIISANGLSVSKFCSDLVMYLASNPQQMGEPVLIYLQTVDKYLPDPVKQEASYVKITYKLAKALSPINPYRLTRAGVYGSATGGQNEAAILTQTPLSQLQSKIIVLTNFNTKAALKPTYSSYSPTLDEYCNFIYKPATAATSASATASASSRNILLADVSGSQVPWTDHARVVWYMAAPQGAKATSSGDPNAIPTTEAVDQATTVGIQSIPIPFIYSDPTLTQPIIDLWKGYAWRLKPEDARYTKPDPVVPATPSQTMNARVSPALQPGQMVV